MKNFIEYERYGRKSIRLKNWDYSQNVCYFVTICVKNKNEIFGKVKNGGMALNEYGKIAEKCWLDIPKHYPNCSLNIFIIMPNHIHGIVPIDNDFINIDHIHRIIRRRIRRIYHVDCNCNHRRVQACLYPTMTMTDATAMIMPISMPKTTTKSIPITKNNIINRCHETLFLTIGSYKSAVSKQIHELELPDFQWQRSFYDHIIRNESDLKRVQQYIINNPLNWSSDRNNPENLYM